MLLRTILLLSLSAFVTNCKTTDQMSSLQNDGDLIPLLGDIRVDRDIDKNVGSSYRPAIEVDSRKATSSIFYISDRGPGLNMSVQSRVIGISQSEDGRLIHDGRELTLERDLRAIREVFRVAKARDMLDDRQIALLIEAYFPEEIDDQARVVDIRNVGKNEFVDDPANALLLPQSHGQLIRELAVNPGAFEEGEECREDGFCSYTYRGQTIFIGPISKTLLEGANAASVSPSSPEAESPSVVREPSGDFYRQLSYEEARQLALSSDKPVVVVISPSWFHCRYCQPFANRIRGAFSDLRGDAIFVKVSIANEMWRRLDRKVTSEGFPSSLVWYKDESGELMRVPTRRNEGWIRQYLGRDN